MTPDVSVIITTYNRPHLLPRAARSVLSQTLRDLELIVVLDGPDPVTMEVVNAIRDDRLRVHVQPVRRGQSAAINAGVAIARGRWIALLDDDDEWMPQKLSVQFACAQAHSQGPAVVGCRFLARSEYGDVCWPLRNPLPDESIDEYLFCRTRLVFGEGIIPTSMLFAPAHIFRAHGMNESIPNHSDLDWLIRVGAAGVRCILPEAPEPLAVWHMEEQRDRMSNHRNWRSSCEWIASMRPLVTERAYAGFLLTWASASARAQGDYSAASFLLRESFRQGRPGFRELAVYGAVWALPPGIRSRFSRLVSDQSKDRKA